MTLNLSAPQYIYLKELNTKFRAYVGGFGSGKTYVGAVDASLFAGANPSSRIKPVVQGYFAPTYRDIMDTFWPTLDEAAVSLGFTTKTRKADKEIDLYRGKVNYGTIICRSMDDPSGIVGFKTAQSLVDEIDILPIHKATNAWNKIIARQRLVLPGVANGIGVTTTPEGFKFVYNRFKKRRHNLYSMVQASTYENEQFLPKDYIESLRENYPDALIDAYLLGEFVNLTSGTVYRNYDRETNRSCEVVTGKEPIFVGQDFNVANMASVIYVKRLSPVTAGIVWHAVDELSGLFDTPATITALKERYPDNKVYVYPDASGSGRKTSDASTSDLALFRQAGFAVRAKKANPMVKDRVLSANRAFENRLVMVNDDKCPDFAESLEQQAYSKSGEPDKTSGHDHMNDAGTYLIAFEMPIKKPVTSVNIGWAT